MPKEGRFDVLEFPLPTQGMNQHVSPEALPFSSAALFENIIPRPLGEGRVRYGTEKIETDLPPESEIQEIFDFTLPSGEQQVLLYVQEFQQDLTANTFKVNGNTFSFKTENTEQYFTQTPLKVVYQLAGEQTLYADILEKKSQEGEISLTLENNSFPNPFDNAQVSQVLVATGSLYVFDFKTLKKLKENLAVHSIPRGVTFQNHFILCNGVDPIMSWDGDTLKVIEDFVLEQANTFQRVNETQFSFVVEGFFEEEKYQNQNKIQLKINGDIYEFLVDEIQKEDSKITLTIQGKLPPWTGNDRLELYYRDFPPAFSSLAVLHNRLWAFGEGATQYSRYRPHPLRVYYCAQPESITQWFDEQSKQVPFLDVGYQQGVADQLEAMTTLRDKTLFLGRYRTQVWQGKDPTDQLNDFQWSSTLEGGTVHGNLVFPVGNSVFFVSAQGLHSLGIPQLSREVVITSEPRVNSFVEKSVKEILSFEKNYRKARCFSYSEGGIQGIKLGPAASLIAFVESEIKGWGLFSGDFQRALAFCSLRGRLLLGIQNSLYVYRDGFIDPPLYQDANSGAISFLWMLPKLSFGGKKFACKRCSLEVAASSSLTQDRQTLLELHFSGEFRQTFSFHKLYFLASRGDVLNQEPLAKTSTQQSQGFRLDHPFQTLMGRCNFVSRGFWTMFTGQIKTGPLDLKKLVLYGRKER